MASSASTHPYATQPQLPVAWNVDPLIYALEEKSLFSYAPNYLGHALMVPNVGDYPVLDERGHYQHLMETGMGRFHQWYRNQLEAFI